ncbi:FAD-binding oxidoreductase [Synechococcus sp. NOUM97013]|uniref:NAD(P)/FAD-dependent oxidoreductase n=1 Tax=Synechococcus sp. NOUM97013 TaxID=1442555 RepID=UPI001647E358|nr:FAD-dependent oxidoreductase [Synechococcus sp. NOUM97013]QNI74995.1 putative D-amino-acid dehydrogenase [Synechococcus sp. NOUM97013]
MIGAGVVGTGTAWHLAEQGHQVLIADPSLADPVPESSTGRDLNGTTASLGVLMGHAFRRSSGRAWRLRQRSMALWPGWIKRLNHPDTPLQLQTPLIQLVGSADEAARLRQLAASRPESGLQFVENDQLPRAKPDWPQPGYGSMRSEHDGRVDPLQLLKALRRALSRAGVDQLPIRIKHLERLSGERQGWQLHSQNGQAHKVESVVICTALGSQGLLQPLGHDRPMDAVLGQVLDLAIDRIPDDWASWPAVLTCAGINLIRHSGNRLWLGATLEPGETVDPSAIERMRSLEGLAPEWLQDAELIGQWHGLRARPRERPAPLLETLEPGLLLASGHYRNGVLLTPATAEWVEEQIDNATITSP